MRNRDNFISNEMGAMTKVQMTEVLSKKSPSTTLIKKKYPGALLFMHTVGSGYNIEPYFQFRTTFEAVKRYAIQ